MLMKTTFAKQYGRLLKLAAATLMAVGVHTAQAVIIPVSPVGQWDCVIHGPGQAGIIFLNFTPDIDTNSGFPTFEGFFIQAGHQGINNSSGSSSGRGGTTTVGRGGSSGSSSFTNLFGGGFIEGTAGGVAENGTGDDWLTDSRGRRGNWFFNSKGQIVGSFFTTLDATTIVTNFFQTCTNIGFPIPLTNGSSFSFFFDVCFTNAVLSTNVPWGPAEDGETGFTNLNFTNANFTLGAIGVTNNVSFIGKIVMNKRITLTGTSTFGKFTVTGVPLQPVRIVSGLPIDGPFLWTGTKSQDGIRLAEEFSLTDTGIPNLYGMTGQGPSYSYGPTNSFCMISAKKRIAFSVSEAQLNGTPNELQISRATVGTFRNTGKAIGAKTVGDSAENLDIIRFNASVTPFIP
jgi:hypothetical protein